MMVLLFAAAAAASAVPAPANNAPRPVAVEAVATVRIVSGVALKLDSPTNADAPPAHDAKVTADGKPRPARLIEFE
jgi:hypothetical protein